MQPSLTIIALELFALVFLGFLAALIIIWRGKKRRQADLERLIDEMNDGQPLRRKKIAAALREHFPIDESSAKDLAAALFGAEKAFLVQFIEQQMQGSVAGFYENLSELLDDYLLTASATTNDGGHVGKKTAAGPEAAISEDTGQPSFIVDNIPPDWGDVFE